MLRCLIVCLAIGMAATLSPAGDVDSYIGKEIKSFSLSNAYGKAVSLSDFDDKKVIVVTFLGTECPLAKLYGRRLRDMQNDLSDRGVQFIGINSNLILTVYSPTI